MGNQFLEKENASYFYVIEADRDGTRKYVSRSFPGAFQYTIKLNKAQHFPTEESASRFITRFRNGRKYPITNPVIRKVERKFTVTENFCSNDNEGCIPYERLNEIATQAIDGLIEDDSENAYEYFINTIKMSQKEMKYFGIIPKFEGKVKP